MTLRRRTALVALTAAACTTAAAAPALAADGANNVNVSVTAAAGTRQFDVFRSDGTTPLTALDLGTNGALPFKTRVRDTSFNVVKTVTDASGTTTSTRPYSVTATMSDLYRKTSTGYDLSTRVPSSALSISQGALSASDVVSTVAPRLKLSGVLAACTDLPTATLTTLGIGKAAVGGALGTLTGTIGTVTGSLPAPVAALCTALTSTGKTVDETITAATAPVTGILDVAKLPNPLTAGAGGSFTNPDFTQDARAKTDTRRTGAAAPTGITVMNGASGTALAGGLVTDLTTKLTTTLNTLPLVAETGVTRVPLSTVTGALGAVGAAVTGLTAAQQTAVLSTLTTTVLPPVLTDLLSVAGDYYANPTLSAAANAPVAGVYEGTMTLTFVQS